MSHSNYEPVKCMKSICVLWPYREGNKRNNSCYRHASADIDSLCIVLYYHGQQVKNVIPGQSICMCSITNLFDTLSS